ncbi:hypothetical protein D3C74_402530 [compost metagenome]
MRQNHQHGNRHAERHMGEQYGGEAKLDAGNGEQDQKGSPDNNVRTDDQHIVQREQCVLRPAAAAALNGQRSDDRQQRGNRRRQERYHQRVDHNNDQARILQDFPVIIKREALEFMHRTAAVERVVH